MARVLVADDEDGLRLVLRRGLETAGHVVVDVADGAEALMALDREPFDVMIADIVMPVVDGIALALKAASDHPRMRIVLVTGYAEELARARNLEALVQRVVSKPYAVADMARLIDDLTSARGA